MASIDQLRQTFFEECSELLQQTETGLTDLREGREADEAVNAVFRAVHSVKGGAGIFGFEALVEFAHVFETALDLIRRGSMIAAPEVIDLMLTASDVLSDLVQMSQAGEEVSAGFGGDTRAALEHLIESDGSVSSDGEEEAAPADFEDLEFTPVMVDTADDGLPSYRFVLRPSPELLKQADQPQRFFSELRRLGELELQALTDELPPLFELDCGRPYITWTGTLRTGAERSAVDEAFAVVGGDIELNTESLDATPPMPDVTEELASSAPETVTPASENPIASARSQPGERSPGSKPAATTTRIELEKIDRVVNMVGELVISQAMLAQVVNDLPEGTAGRLAQILDEVIHHTRELKDSVMSMRAQPVGSVFQRMPRLVRELAVKTSKKVRIEVAGETTEVDRSIIERLGDPLTHIIRNSVDHGIEAPSVRLAAGKAEEGVVRLSAEHRGGRIVIEVSDDGAGINSDRVFKKAVEKGLVSGEASLSEDEINNLIMLPGFSTAEKISDISGRGVGMDVVRSNIQDIGGRISLKSERGRGMKIQLALPLTLAVMEGMVIRAGQETYVVAMSAIMECLRPASSDINNLIGTRGMLKLRGDLIPLVGLGEILDLDGSGSESGDNVVIITEAGDGRRFGLVVDELLGHQQVVIKSIEESYGAVPGIAAATILGNGQVAFILDVEKLSDLAANTDTASMIARSGSVAKSFE